MDDHKHWIYHHTLVILVQLKIALSDSKSIALGTNSVCLMNFLQKVPSNRVGSGAFSLTRPSGQSQSSSRHVREYLRTICGLCPLPLSLCGRGINQRKQLTAGPGSNFVCSIGINDQSPNIKILKSYSDFPIKYGPKTLKNHSLFPQMTPARAISLFENTLANLFFYF